VTCILQIGSFTERLNRGLAAEHEVLRLWETDADSLLEQHAERIEVVATSGRFGCTATLIERLPNLRAIVSFGVGYDGIDVVAAKARDIPVSNTPDVLTDATADLAITLLLMVARRTGEGERHLRGGHWTGWRPTSLAIASVSWISPPAPRVPASRISISSGCRI